ncbi:MAG: glycerol kinase, partial [Kordiimonadaceae bacterium]|nr:glycerol kinase [Kordiimonadaceae bacterium]
DGGMASSDWTMQFLSDILGVSVDRPKILETTAVGAAYMAGFYADLLPGPDEYAQKWVRESRFIPEMSTHLRKEKYDRWQDCVSRVLSEPPK